jgi:hypothetical protein
MQKEDSLLSIITLSPFSKFQQQVRARVWQLTQTKKQKWRGSLGGMIHITDRDTQLWKRDI